MGPLVTLNLDGTERRVHSDLWRIWLLPGVPEPGVLIRVQIDPEAPIRWEELDRLPELVELQYAGRDPRVQEYLAGRPQISRFGWSDHEQSVIDLSGSHLAEFSFSCGEGPLEVRLPADGTLERLALSAPAHPESLRIEAPDEGAGIHLMQGCGGQPDRAYALRGLDRLRSLSLSNAAEVRLGALLQYRALEELTIVGPPGGVRELQQLAAFPKLRRVVLLECYEMEAGALPPLSAFPALESVEIDGIRQADAAIVSARLAGLRGLSIRGKRTDGWLRANLHNPFREWPDEHGATVGKAAISAYRLAAAAVEKACAKRDPAGVQAALQAMVLAFNRTSARTPFDTIQREQVSEAFDEVAARAAEVVPLGTAREWFDEWEDL